MKKLSKTEAREQIEIFFSDIKNKDSKEVKKIKKLAMNHNIPLKELRKKFCRKCLSPYKNPRIKIVNGMKNTNCENCGYVARYRI